MSRNNFKIRINTLTDRFNSVLYKTALSAVCVGISYYTASPLITAGALAYSYFANFSFINNQIARLQGGFPATAKEDIPNNVRRLPFLINHYSRKLGLTSPPSLHILDANPNRTDMWSLMLDPDAMNKSMQREAMKELLGDQSMALVLGIKNPVVIINKPLIENLNSTELSLITAHELAHVSTNASLKKQTFTTLKNAVAINGSWGVVATALGSRVGLEVLGGWLAFNCFLALGFRIEQKEASTVSAVQTASRTLLAGSLLAAGYFADRPEILGAWAAAAAATTAAKLIHESYSRCGEFQADRIAAEVTRKPKFLSSALTKTSTHNDKVASELMLLDYTKGSWLFRPLKWTAALFFVDHPPISERCTRLEKMARRFEKTSAPTPR